MYIRLNKENGILFISRKSIGEISNIIMANNEKQYQRKKSQK